MGRTQFIIEDFSDIRPNPIAQNDSLDRAHLFFVFTSDKGPESFQKELNLNKATALYIKNKKSIFRKHGQPLLGMLNCVSNGGLAMTKRVVASDATLAHVGIAVRVKNEAIPKMTKDANGNDIPVYVLDSDPTQDTLNAALAQLVTINGVTSPVQRTIPTAVISFEHFEIGVGPSNDVDLFASAFESLIQANAPSSTVYPTNGDEGLYPLFLIAANGRGESSLKFFIDADTSRDRPVDYVKYLIRITENDKILETLAFTINPDTIENMRNISLTNAVRRYSNQIRVRQFEDAFEAFIANVTTITGITSSDYQNSDIFNGLDLSGNKYENIKIDTTTTNALDSLGSDGPGIALYNGDDGDFKNFPLNSSEYSARLKEVFDMDEIYDLDSYRIDAIIDQNYPTVVKRAIEALVDWRQDCVYLRDLGLNLNTIDQILDANTDSLKSRFCASYHNSWAIEDPFTRKQITVTIGYSLVPKFCAHFLGGVSRPFCGIPFGISWSLGDDIIDGTVNFTPRYTPHEDQVQVLKDARINYCVDYNGILSMESEFTSQTRYTQLSFLNNILNLQMVIRAIRRFCPLNRYRFITTNDLSRYQEDVNTILDQFATNYQTLKLVYAKDENYENNKIYYAYIYVRFYNFIADEMFRVAVLSTNGSGYEDSVAFNTGTGTEY